MAIGLGLGILSTRLTDVVPVPAPAMFLVAAALVSDIWPGIYEHVPIQTVERIAVVALIVILSERGDGHRLAAVPRLGRPDPARSGCSARS